MKFLIKTTLAAILISGAGAEAADRHGEALNAIDEKQGFLPGVPGSVLFFVRVQDDGAEPKKEKTAEQGEKEARVPDEATLRKGRARTRKQLETVQRKIEGDHALWTRAGEGMKESRERIAELEASLARERLQFERLRQSIVRIEREHNGDHDREEELAAELSGHDKALREFEGKQDAITKLEKKAAELRRQAVELRKRAEELRGK